MSQTLSPDQPMHAAPKAEADIQDIAANPGAPSAHHKRWLTLGEKTFDLATYGGFSWLGNEALSTVIGNYVGKPGNWANRAFNTICDRASVLSRAAKLDRYWTDRPLWILVLTIGGNLITTAVRYCEYKKFEAVTQIDRWVYGEERVRQDPRIVQAHADMRAAPQQSWASLWKGRALTVGLALGLDLFSGNERSPTTRMFNGTPLRAYANMERAGTTIARDALGLLHPDAQIRRNIRAARAESLTSGMYKIGENEGKAARMMGGNFGFVLVLSAVLTAIFFVSSRLFAAKHEEKKQRKLEARLPALDDAPQTDLAQAADAPQKAGEPRPRMQVQEITREAMAPALSPQIAH